MISADVTKVKQPLNHSAQQGEQPSIKKQNKNIQTTQGFRFSIGRIIRITEKKEKQLIYCVS